MGDNLGGKLDPKASAAALEPTELIMRDNGVEARTKINAVQKTLRVQQVVSWLLDGNTYSNTIVLCMDKWGISERQAARYIADAREQMEAYSAGEIKAATMTQLYRLTDLYLQALEEKDLKVALDVVKTTARMLGLNAPDKVEAKSVDGWESMTVAKQLETVGQILQRAQESKRDVN